MRDNKGFTLIELLIVVVIIGILAAIAIPKFSATREKAYFAAMKSDLKNLASQQEIYYSDTYSYTARAWSEFPDMGPAPQALAVIYHREGDFKAAIEAAGAASVAYEGSDAVSNHLLAHSLAAEGRWSESVTARLMTIEAGEGHQWQQWLWLGQAYAYAGDTVQALTALDSARVRTENPASVGQIDSIRATLRDSENATGSQNP